VAASDAWHRGASAARQWRCQRNKHHLANGGGVINSSHQHHRLAYESAMAWRKAKISVSVGSKPQ